LRVTRAPVTGKRCINNNKDQDRGSRLPTRRRLRLRVVHPTKEATSCPASILTSTAKGQGKQAKFAGGGSPLEMHAFGDWRYFLRQCCGGEVQVHSILAVGVPIVKDFVGLVLERTTDVRISEWI
jgi:hypothetical protein